MNIRGIGWVFNNIMNNWSFILERRLVCRGILVRGIVLFLIFLAALSGDSQGVDSNPVGQGTMPASSGVGSGRSPAGGYRSGLVQSSGRGVNGNLIITGNVRGGKYFRGIIPYQSEYNLRTSVPSSSLDSFLRDSAGSEDVGGGASKYMTQPYYSGTRSVTTTRPDDGGIFRPASTRIDDRVGGTSILSPLPRQEVLVRKDAVIPYTGTKLRPLSMSLAELERVILEEVEAFSEKKRLSDEQHRPRIEPLLQDLRTANDRATELKQGLLVEDKLLQLPPKAESDEEKIKKPETAAPEQVMGEGALQSQEGAFGVPDVQVDIYEQMKRQIDSARRFLEQPAGVEQAKEEVKAVGEAKRRDEEPFGVDAAQRETRRIAAQRGKQEVAGSKEVSLPFLPEGEAAEKSGVLEEPFKTTTDDGRQITEVLRDSSRIPREENVAAKARAILGEHKTFASFAEDKFNTHMRAAEEYLKRGRYYRAADAYTLASIYKPADPLAYAGKSHALFAAGEYMSSALFLTRALEIFPEYAQFKIDLVAMVGDKDKLESRITNAEKWLDESDAVELQFLLGYVYYQMGRQAEATEMINAAFEKMPESPAVVALKKVIAAGN